MRNYFLIVILVGIFPLCLISCNKNSEENPDVSALSCMIEMRTNTERFLRHDSISDSRYLHIFSARNEWETVQILVRSNEGVTGLNVILNDFSGPHDSFLPADSFRFYRAHQLEITKKTWNSDEFRPGWYPDPLIPVVHPVTGLPLTGNRFQAFPFDLPANETHTLLVDLYIPTSTRAGDFTGTISLQDASGNKAEIELTITVWNFTLPPQHALKTAFMTPERQLRHKAWIDGISYPDSYWTEISEQGNVLLKNHGINATKKLYTVYVSPDEAGNFTAGNNAINAIQNFIETYQVNAVEIPFWGNYTAKDILGVADQNSFDPGTVSENQKEYLRNYFISWDNVIERLESVNDIVFYVYLSDEPNSAAAYEFVRMAGGIIRGANLKYLKILVVEQTRPDSASWGNLYGAVDIWCPTFRVYHPATALERQALGEDIWTYTALTHPGYPHWHTDAPLWDYRMPTWMSWRYSIHGLLYWSMAYWFEVNDPWTEPNTYSNNGPYTFNGEGVLVYPAEDVGYAGITPSLRLKVIRDSIEDYDYFTLLEESGLLHETETLITPLVRSWSSWEKNPLLYESVRQQLGTLLSNHNK